MTQPTPEDDAVDGIDDISERPEDEHLDELEDEDAEETAPQDPTP